MVPAITLGLGTILSCGSGEREPLPQLGRGHISPEIGTSRDGAGVTPLEGQVNRLIHEKSPYLLQHAHNPVDWHPWNAEALERARREELPIFLSVGYSTCHWCHVMERESFSDPEIARIINQNFVPIKVDREERPDIDELYMNAVVAMTGQGGWPLTAFLTPEGEPFWGGTYFPPEDRYGRPGFRRVLLSVAGAWRERREEILSSAGEIRSLLGTTLERTGREEGELLTEATLRRAFDELASSFDARHGGFGRAPKFPQGHVLSFLLRYAERTGEGRALHMADFTLKQMARGGIQDHLGGGFHRYSTDGEWQVPHFEKMLYDQAVLAQTYLAAYQATGEENFSRTARGILDYVLRDLATPGGGFCSAEDADSEGEEGRFYVWRPEEIASALSPEGARLFLSRYGVSREGNFEGGRSVLLEARSLDDLAEGGEVTPEKISSLLDEARSTLLARRDRRARPFRDDKLITAWNGLMISALAQGAMILDEPAYLEAAQTAADFLLTRLWVDGRLMRRYRDGEVAIPAFLDDYVFLAGALLDLYAASFRPERLREARDLMEEAHLLFRDEEGGGYFMAAEDGENLLVRQRAGGDGALPGGAGTMALAWLRLAELTNDEAAWKRGEEALGAALSASGGHSTGGATALAALDYYLGPRRQVVIAPGEKPRQARALLDVVRSRYLPRAVVLWNPPGEGRREARELSPFLESQEALGGLATAYVCEDFACRLPVTTAEELGNLLETSGALR